MWNVDALPAVIHVSSLYFLILNNRVTEYNMVVNCFNITMFLLFLCVVDIISAIEFNKSGQHLATGDRGGRVVLFERTDAKDVCIWN